jgi:hypothetical protein
VEASLELIVDCYRCTKEYRALGERREGSALSISRYFATLHCFWNVKMIDRFAQRLLDQKDEIEISMILKLQLSRVHF